MKRMHLTLGALVVAVCMLTVLYTGCIKDECKGIVCENEGVCVDRACACRWGYEGQRCETAWLTKFSGAWHATDRYQRDTTGTLHKYDIAIEGAHDSFYVANLSNIFRAVRCKLVSKTEFSIPEQRPDSLLTIKSGKGTYDAVRSTVSGVYSYSFAKYRNDTLKIDTTVTINFTWAR